MRFKYISGGLLASTVFSVAALAQVGPPSLDRAPTAAAPVTTTETITTTQIVTHTSQWRASKLIGVNVYNTQNEKLGDISEILLDQSGKVSSIVVGVGGFLGIGERDILVGLDKLNFVNEPLPSTTGAANNARSPRMANEKWYPDHAVMNATKDQLKAMPQFTYSDHN
jgi:sporulation protein YlmC with PRC-barrel domain